MPYYNQQSEETSHHTKQSEAQIERGPKLVAQYLVIEEDCREGRVCSVRREDMSEFRIASGKK